VLAAVVEGVARGCKAHDMPILGGETAQLPDIYELDDYDLSGTIVGVVSEKDALHGHAVKAGDVLVGYEASGFHTNGYTLVRRVLFGEMGLKVSDRFPQTGHTVAEVLLAVHRSYFKAIWPVRSRVHALAHITGGGILGNLNRVLPKETDARIRSGTWPVPAWCSVVQQGGGITDEEMRHVFNLGIGMIAVCAASEAEVIRKAAGMPTWIIGEIIPGSGQVQWA
jgi:phosphoribosylformylglycinamidine cyclo-ligase